MSFRPLRDRVLVRRDETETVSKGGILLSAAHSEKPSEGIVVAVGDGIVTGEGVNIPVDLEVGDHILFDKWAGTDIKIDGETLRIMQEADVLGVLSA